MNETVGDQTWVYWRPSDMEKQQKSATVKAVSSFKTKG